MRTFQKGAEVSRFVARDVRRDIVVLDDANIADGYVLAKVRTRNILYSSKGLADNPAFGSPEILHLERAWEWGGESWGGTSPPRKIIPHVDPVDFSDTLKQLFPNAQLNTEIVNPDHKSWCMMLSINGKSIEFVWGPLSGFGAINWQNQDVDDPFGYCDTYLYSVDDAIAFAKSHFGNEAS